MSKKAWALTALILASATIAGAARRARPGDSTTDVSRLAPADLVATAAVPGKLVVIGCEGDASGLRGAIEATGAEPLALVGADAWLVRASHADLPSLRALAQVSDAAELSRADRISPRLAAALATGGPPTIDLRVSLVPGADAGAWRELLAATPGADLLTVEPHDVRPHASLRVAASSLAAATEHLSRLRDVLEIEPAPQRLRHVDEAAWWLQTGREVPGAADYDVSAKLFRNGLTGRGILIGHADDGLENDACELVYAPRADEAAWPIGPSADDAAEPVPPEGSLVSGQVPPIRTRERKVVAYYLQAGATPYSSPAQHGTRCAEVALGDDWRVLAARPLVRDVGEFQNVRPMNPAGAWMVGQELRPDLIARVDDPASDDPSFPDDFGNSVEHHQSGDGMAPGAQLVFQDIGDANGVLTLTPSLLRLGVQARFTGATVQLLPFGGDPCQDCYFAEARDVDFMTWALRDLVVVASAGNDGALGPATIADGAAQAKSAISVGASERASDPTCDAPGSCPLWSTPRSGEDMWASSSQGPLAGRIQPLIVAPGVMGTRVPVPWPPRPEDGSGSGDMDCGLPEASEIAGGTSLSASAMAGMSALVQQYFLDGYYPTGRATPVNALRPTNALVTAVLVNSARDLLGAGTGPGGSQAHRPNSVQGWGAPRLDDTLYFAGDPEPGPLSDRTERARLVVLADTPNGFDSAMRLSPEPGGRTRDQIVAAFRPALETNGLQEYFIDVDNDRDHDGIPELDDPANEWRITLAWYEPSGGSVANPVVNDLDLEVVSPGPDGILQTSGGNRLGDDVVYRTGPRIAWRDGYTVPSPQPYISGPPYNALNDWPDLDPVNTVENVFVRSQDVVSGTWILRVLGRSVPGNGQGTSDARPNFALNDQRPTRDTDGDTLPDVDEKDTIVSWKQGYALIASGPVAQPPAPVRYIPAAPPVLPRPRPQLRPHLPLAPRLP